MVSSLLPAFLKKAEKAALLLLLAKSLSSTTRLLRVSPTSPRSLVRTAFRALSEKEATLFWAAAPYWRTIWLSPMSIFWEKSSPSSAPPR